MLTFDEDKKSGLFTASTDSVLIIENRSLGYQVDIYLHRFSMSDQTLHYVYYPLFRPMFASQKTMARWGKQRRKTYQGSLNHFLSVLARGYFKESRFEVYRGALDRSTGEVMPLNIRNVTPVDMDQFIARNPIDHSVNLRFENHLMVVYQDYSKGRSRYPHFDYYPVSSLGLRKDFVLLDSSGVNLTLGAFEVSGSWGTQRIADLLPVNYRPEPESE